MTDRVFGLDRRNLMQLAAGAALAPAAFPLPARAAAEPAATDSLSPLSRASRDAWLFGLPLIESAGARARLLEAGAPPGRLLHKRTLSTAKDTAITAPNNDTLYSNTWLDLAAGPVRVSFPPTGRRYFSIAVLDMYTDNVAVLGTRTMGTEGGSFIIVAPGAATDDPLAVRATSRWVWLLVRTLIDGASDLAAAHAVQDAIRIEGPSVPIPTQVFADRNAPWDRYFDSVQQLVIENPPHATDMRVFHTAAPLGLGPRGGFRADRFNAAQVREIEAGVAAAKAELHAARDPGAVVGSWAYPRYNLGAFGQDYLYRAQVALGGIAALPRAEAMYLSAVDPQGRPALQPGSSWRLRFPADQPIPVDSFWSLTLYRVTPEGQAFFVENPIDRWSIGDRTAGLRRGSDGSLAILVSPTAPPAGSSDNWLPAPRSEPYRLTLRAYLPRAELTGGVYRPPDLTPA